MKRILFSVICLCVGISIQAQTEVMAWGNLTGIRVDGYLFPFETFFRVTDAAGVSLEDTGKERQSRPSYSREGDTQYVKTWVQGVRYEQRVTDTARGTSGLSLSCRADLSVFCQADTTLQSQGAFFCIAIPLVPAYAEKCVLEVDGIKHVAHTLRENTFTGARLTVQGHTAELGFRADRPVEWQIQKLSGDMILISVPLLPENFTRGAQGELQLSVCTARGGGGQAAPVRLSLQSDRPGRLFDGLGGNFRLQNPRVDPPVIDYCLDSLRVAWGRVEMPWRDWHPREQADPLAEARAGKISKRVADAMEMARRLSAMGMPVIVSCWFPPEWAIEGDPASYVHRGGIQAYRLDPAKERQIYRSLADYLVCLKEACGVEAVMFSFNESDLGIDVLHTAREHAAFIKGFGRYLAERGLATRMLLGDNSDATTFDFIVPALEDPDTYPYIGAVSFHSWRGCDDATLRRWAEASRTLNVPLIIGEGSTDAAAHVYPQIFAESTFAFYEINLYIRLCAICQPLSILQWQLTSDYSILWGGGCMVRRVRCDLPSGSGT